MAQADFTELTNSLSSGAVRRGVTAGQTPPNGGGSFVYGFNSTVTTPGAVGLFCNLVNFAPMAKGGRATGCMKRGLSGGPTNFSPFLHIGLGGPDVSDVCYMLGLQDDDPSKICLRKGQFSQGLPAGAPGVSGILRVSDETVDPDVWAHLRLDMVVNLNGDVILKCFKNDLNAHAATAPTWTAIPGMADFTDDALGVNSGSVPYTSGRIGWGFATKDVTRRAYFDQVEIIRQL
jgi:hypothetical protein